MRETLATIADEMSRRKQILYILCMLGWVLGVTPLCAGATPRITAGNVPVDSLDAQAKASEFFYKGTLAQRVDKTQEALDLLRRAHTLAPQDPAIAFALGQLYMSMERQTEALPLIETAYRSDSTNIAYAEALSSAYVALERMQDALHVNEYLGKVSPDDVDIKYRLVQLYARTGNLDKAIRLASELQLRFRSHPEAYARLTQMKIQLLKMKHDTKAVEAEYKEQARLFPEERQPYYDFILYLIQSKRYKEVEKQLSDDLRKKNIREGDAVALRVHSLIAQGAYDRAEQMLSNLNKDRQISASEKFVLWTLLSKSVSGEEKLLSERYMPYIKELVDLYPDELELLRSYARLLRYREQYTDAIALLRPKTKLHPEDAGLWDELFQDAIGVSDEDLIVEVAREALHFVPEDWRYYIALASGDFAKEQYEDAKRILEKGAEAISPQTGIGAAKLYGLLADLYAEKGNAEEQTKADSLYQRAIEANPQDADVLNNYAYRLAKAGRELALAERYAGQAIKLRPKAAHILDTYAYILYLRGNYTLAKLYQKNALDEAGEEVSGDMYEHMGDILLALGDQAEALNYLAKAAIGYESQGKSEEKAKVEAKIHRVSGLRKSSTR